jgi:glutamyl-tRNA synthetase
VPLILGADKKRLSKRHGATSVMEYGRQGYLPAAMMNFLALLGWSPGGDRELLSARELIESFTLEGISGGNAVFNAEKLDWMNGQYLARLPIEEVADAVRPLFGEAGLAGDNVVSSASSFQQLLALLRPRVKRLTDFVDQARPLLADAVAYETDAIEKHLASPGILDHVSAVTEALRQADPFDEPHVESAVRGTAAERGIKAAQLIHAVRVGLTGRTASPGLFEVIVLLGRDRTVARLERLLAFLSSRA